MKRFDPALHEAGDIPLPHPKWEIYAMAVYSGMSAQKAYEHAGYRAGTPGKPSTAIRRLRDKDIIQARIAWLQKEAAEKTVVMNVESTVVTRNEIIDSLRRTRALARDRTETVGKDGEIIPAPKMDLSAANRADEILAKMHGFSLDVVRNEDFDAELEGMGTEQLNQLLLSLLEQVDPNMRKKLIEQVEASVDDSDLSGDRTLQ